MKIQVAWQQDASFVGQTQAGHRVIMDGPPDQGGKDLGPRPMELLLMGLGGCTSFDVVSILRKMRQPVEDCRVEIEAERAAEVPAVFTRIHIHFIVTGQGLKEALVRRAVKLSAEEYCSASLMLERGGVAISHGYEIREAG